MFNIFFIISQIFLLIAFLVGDVSKILSVQKKQSRSSLRLVILTTLLHIINMSILIIVSFWFRASALPEWLKPYFTISYVSNMFNIAAVWYAPQNKQIEKPSLLRHITHFLIVLNTVLAFCKVTELF
jgi:hypothetical protein